MESIRIIKAFDNGLSYNRSFDYNTPDYKKQISITVQNALSSSESLDIVSVESTVAFSVKEEQLFQFKVVIFYEVKGWAQTVNALDNKEAVKELPEVELLTDMTIGYLRGSLAALSKNTPVDGLILPVLPAKELVAKLKLDVR
jgi:hypothetical protein